MSHAKVKFYTHPSRNDECAPGQEAYFSFHCPNGNECGLLPIAGKISFKRDGQNQNGGIAQWDWNGNREKPTFGPSIDCKTCWHGYIIDGQCKNA